MSRIATMIVKETSSIKPGPEGGTTIGTAYAGLLLEVLLDDPESPHDGFVTIKGPKPDPVKTDGTWKSSGKVGWIELAHMGEVAPNEHEYKLIVDAATGAVKSCVMVR